MGNVLASILCIHSFSAHYVMLLTENNMKSIPTINPAITENTDGTIVKARAPVIDIKVDVPVALTRCIIRLHFISGSSNVWLPFQAKDNITSAPTSTALT